MTIKIQIICIIHQLLPLFYGAFNLKLLKLFPGNLYFLPDTPSSVSSIDPLPPTLALACSWLSLRFTNILACADHTKPLVFS